MSEWTDFVRNYADQHGVTYGAAMKMAAPHYRKRKPRRKAVGGSINNELYHMGNRLGQIFGGAEQPKGALAALLSGLDAQIKIN